MLFQQPDNITTTIDELTLIEKPVVHQIRKVSRKIRNLLEKLPHQEVDTYFAILFISVLSACHSACNIYLPKVSIFFFPDNFLM